MRRALEVQDWPIASYIDSDINDAIVVRIESLMLLANCNLLEVLYDPIGPARERLGEIGREHGPTPWLTAQQRNGTRQGRTMLH